jgi:hypothetical protein
VKQEPTKVKHLSGAPLKGKSFKAFFNFGETSFENCSEKFSFSFSLFFCYFIQMTAASARSEPSNLES